MDFKIIWTDSAIADLEEICRYIGQDNRAAAQRVGREFWTMLKSSKLFPTLARLIRAVPVERCVKLFIGNIEFFMKSRKKQNQLTSFASGMAHGGNQICDDHVFAKFRTLIIDSP